MNSTDEKANQFLQELGRQIGLTDLEYNADLVCCLEAGGRIQVQIESSPETGELVFLAKIGDAPASDREIFFRELLCQNFLFQGTAGETLCVEPTDDRIMLCRVVSLESVPVAKALGLFSNFLGTADGWIDRLNTGLVPKITDSVSRSIGGDSEFNLRA